MMNGAISSGIHSTVYTAYCMKSGTLSTVTVELVRPLRGQNFYKRPRPGSMLSSGARSWISNLIMKTLIRALVVTFAASAARADEAKSVVNLSR